MHCHLVERVLGVHAARLMLRDETRSSLHHPTGIIFPCTQPHVKKQVAVSLEMIRIFLRKYI